MLIALLGIKGLNSHLVPSSPHINITSTNGHTDDYLNHLLFHLCRRKTLQTTSQITPKFKSLKSDFTLPIKPRHIYFTSSGLGNTAPYHHAYDNTLVHGYEKDLLDVLQKSKIVEPVGEKTTKDIKGGTRLCSRRAIIQWKRSREERGLDSCWCKPRGGNSTRSERKLAMS